MLVEQFTQIAVQAIVAGAVVIITAIKTGIISFLQAKSEELKSKKTTQEYNLLRDICSTGVQFAEQIGKRFGISGEEKLNEAKTYILSEAKRHHLDVEDKHIQPIIEALVKAMNETRDVLLDKLTETVP
ncbi:hypothetical protein KG091_04405 [Carnobacteriaceae bacterium zg-ZUI78]|nr:hypothetical protein [Carnobacteriaceae bacterium zg-ZUI78]